MVEHEVKQHFKGQFHKRKTKFELMSEDWKKIYEQRSDIRTDWYKDTEKDIEEDEWQEMIKELKSDTAPGITEISYILIKKADNKIHRFFRKFASLCIELERIPAK